MAFALAGGGPIGVVAGAVLISGGVVATCAFLGWFAALVLGRMPMGLRDLTAYGTRLRRRRPTPTSCS